MTKEEAAEFLGVSVRTLQRLVSEGLIPSPQKVMMRRDGDRQAREVALFDPAALEAYKRNPPPKVSRPAALTVTTAGSLTRQTQDGAALAPGDDFAGRMLAALEAQTIGQKVLLSLNDCRQLTGLSDAFLRDQIHAGKLKGKILGRGYKVKRADLDTFIRKL